MSRCTPAPRPARSATALLSAVSVVGLMCLVGILAFASTAHERERIHAIPCFRCAPDTLLDGLARVINHSEEASAARTRASWSPA